MPAQGIPFDAYQLHVIKAISASPFVTATYSPSALYRTLLSYISHSNQPFPFSLNTSRIVSCIICKALPFKADVVQSIFIGFGEDVSWLKAVELANNT